MTPSRALTLMAVFVAALPCACAERSPGGSSWTKDDALRVRRGDYREVLHLTGEIEAAEGITIIVPRIPNWQTSIKTLIEDGARVEAGAVIAELDSTPFSTGLEQKRNENADAVQELAQRSARTAGDIEKLELEVERARIELDKARSKAAVPPDIISRREYEDNRLALRRAEVTHQKARNDLESQRRGGRADLANIHIKIDRSRTEIGTAEEAIDSMTLRAPSAGVVIVGENEETGRKFQAGDSVWVGARILSIPNLATLRVSAVVVDVDDGKVAPGQRVEITPDAYPELELTGTVRTITGAAKSLSQESLRRGFTATISLDGASRDRLRPGFSVRATVVRKQVKGVLLAPRAAIDFAGKEPRAHRRGEHVPVKLGGCNAHDCVVLDGLAEGDELSRAASAAAAS